MESKISRLDVQKAKALISEFNRRENARKRKLKRLVTKGEAGKAVTTIGHYAKQKAKSVTKSGAKKIKSWFKK